MYDASRTVHVNGIDLRILEAGDGPLVILCHGFPELAYSWRHQLPALAAAGYRGAGAPPPPPPPSTTTTSFTSPTTCSA
jgi:pimeloyl-ACP methyl ester carboxylesterase